MKKPCLVLACILLSSCTAMQAPQAIAMQQANTICDSRLAGLHKSARALDEEHRKCFEQVYRQAYASAVARRQAFDNDMLAINAQISANNARMTPVMPPVPRMITCSTFGNIMTNCF